MYIFDETVEVKEPNNKTYYTEADWLSTFPEALPYLESRLDGLLEEKESMEQKCKKVLRRTYRKGLKGLDLWFAEKQIEIWYILPIEEIVREISKLVRLLYPSKEEKGITDDMIERAKNYPIAQIMGVQSDRYNVTCPFHSGGKEKNPSMNIRNNYFYCHTCQETGDSISLAMKLRGSTFQAAVMELQ